MVPGPGHGSGPSGGRAIEGPLSPTEAERRAEEFYWGNLRRKSGWERMRLASDLFETLKELCKSGIRAEHPDWTPEQVDAAFKRRLGR